jgi:hypothetical protein
MGYPCRAILRLVYVTVAVVWIAALVFVQGILLVPSDAVRVESRTKIPLNAWRQWLLGHLSKPLSPPKQ